MKKHTNRLITLLIVLCLLGLAACKRHAAVTTAGTSASENVGTTIAETKTEHTHSFGEWAVKTVATCTEKGIKERVCACGEKETEEIPATGHGEQVVRDAQAAGCTQSGYSGDTYCSVCGEKLASGTQIAATGHNFGEWSVKTAATCTEEGIKERVCACGERETQEIAAMGHTFGQWTVTIAADATHDGLEERVCACGEKESRDIPASGELTLSLEAKWEDNAWIVSLVLGGGAGVTNGKVTVSYDAQALSLEEVEMCLPCGLYDINTQTAGALSITWVGSETSETQTLLKLRLTPKDGVESANITAELDEAYAGEMPLTAAPATAVLYFETYTSQKSSYREGGSAK